MAWRVVNPDVDTEEECSEFKERAAVENKKTRR
jgi:hypothetical protein